MGMATLIYNSLRNTRSYIDIVDDHGNSEETASHVSAEEFCTFADQTEKV